MRSELVGLHPALWRYCVVLTASRSDADDLAQRACLRALERVGQFRPGTSLRAWLFTIARRLWLNEVKARKIRAGAGTVDVGDIPLTSNDPGTEANIFASEVLTQIGRLPEGQREAVLLVYAEGFSYREAAEMMEIPIGTVMSRLSAARKALNAALSGNES